MEPERKIEKWLAAYAKKRRGQAGEPFKLDPAARRMLQNEISGRAPSSNDEDETISLWEVLRRQWAFFLGFAVCIFIFATLFLQTARTEKAKVAPSPATMESMRQIPGSTQGPMEKDRSAVTNGILAARTKSQNPPVLLSYNTRPLALAATPAGGNYSAAPMPMTESPMVHAEGGERAEKSAATRMLVPAVRNAYMNTIPPPTQSAPVLADFQVVQNGNTIRVVDRDGSVYTGTLQMERLNADALPEGAATPVDTVTQKGAMPKANSPRMAESDEPATASPSAPGFGGMMPGDAGSMPPAPAYSFRVSGMNRTLKQTVVFTATLMQDLGAVQNAQVTFGMSANAAYGAAFAQQMMKSERTNQAAQLPWSRMRISGTAIINQTNQIEVNARPVAPLKSGVPPN